MVSGYKAFNHDMTNMYGKQFVLGKTYSVHGEIKFGNYGNGFHMCKNLCDVFRYFPFPEVRVASVTGNGVIKTHNDEYYGYYDMYSVEHITINSILSRRDIIDLMIKNSNEHDNMKFIMSFCFTKEEILFYSQKYKNNIRMLCNILYYQFGIETIFQMDFINQQKLVRKLLF